MSRKHYRDVVYIGRQTGPRGGEYWVLLLDCGHYAFRPVPRIDVTTICHGRIRHAPHRVKCATCAAGVEPRPERVLPLMRVMDRICYFMAPDQRWT